MTKQKTPTLQQQRRYVRQWKRTGKLLRQIKMQELAALTDEDTRHAIAALLSPVFTRSAYKHPKYERTSGLLEQQKYFRRLLHP